MLLRIVMRLHGFQDVVLERRAKLWLYVVVVFNINESS